MRTYISTIFAAAIALAASSSAFALVLSGGAVVQTKIAYDAANVVLTSETFTDVASMEVTITTSKVQLVVATFGAESACYGGDVGQLDWCSIRIVANASRLMQPADGDGANFAFDSTDNGTRSFASWQQHQVTRALKLRPGTYKIHVQARVVRFGTAVPNFSIGERTLLVQVIDH
jgi:hypothetical protein